MHKKSIIFFKSYKFWRFCQKLFPIRSLYTLIQGYKFRSGLKKCLASFAAAQATELLPQGFAVDHLTSLDLNDLKARGCEVLILDYDGVLSPYEEVVPSPAVIAWLDQAILLFGAKSIFILSNNPLPARKQFIEQFFQQAIIFIQHMPKPYPDGIYHIAKYLTARTGQKVVRSKMLMVDDRLLTGILAAKIAGIAGCLILSPCTNFQKRFMIEWFFVLIRKLERLIIWHL